MFSSNCEEGKKQSCQLKVKRGLILYRPEKYQRNFFNNIKYGFVSSNLIYEEARPGMRPRRMRKTIERFSVRHVTFYATEENSKFDSLLLLTSRLMSLQKIYFEFCEGATKTNQHLNKQLLKKFFKQNKRILFLDVTLENDKILASNIKAISFLRDLQRLNISYAMYKGTDLLDYFTILTNTLENTYKRRVWKHLKNQHFAFELELDSENLEDWNSLSLSLCKLCDLTKHIKTAFSFYLHLNNLPEQDLTNFQQALKTINNIRDFHILVNAHEGLHSLLNMAKNKNIRNFAISFPQNDQLNEDFLTNFPELMKEMGSLHSITMDLTNLSTGKLLNLFPIHLGGLTMLTNLTLRFPKTRSITDEFLQNLSRSVKKLLNLQEFFLDSESLTLTSFKCLFESLENLTNLKSLKFYIVKSQDGIDDGFMQCLCSSLMKLENLELLRLNLSANNIGDPGIIELTKSLSFLKHLRAVYFTLDRCQGVTSEVALNLFRELSLIKSLFVLSFALKIKDFNIKVMDQLIKYWDSMKSLQNLYIGLRICEHQSKLVLQMMDVAFQKMKNKFNADFSIVCPNFHKGE